MRSIVKGIVACLIVCGFAGCATYIPEMPEKVQSKFEAYKQLPEKKVFVVAIDPRGNYAYGYASGKATLKEAAEEATIKCDQRRNKRDVLSKPIIYAINNKVVYEKMIEKMSN